MLGDRDPIVASLEDFLNRISLMDCVDGIGGLPENSVDLVIADPPYNLSKSGDWKMIKNPSKGGKDGGNWSITNEDWDKLEPGQYWDLTVKWMEAIKRVCKPSATIWIFGTYHNIGIANVILQNQGFELLNEIIWFKPNAYPNLSTRQFSASHENILWAKIKDSNEKYTFNYKKLKRARFKDDFLKKEGKQMRSVWALSNNKTKYELEFGKHPTQKPERLIDRIMMASVKPGDVVLSPFCGAGTDCVSAVRFGASFISFDLDQKYIDIARMRVEREMGKKKRDEKNKQLSLSRFMGKTS